MDAAKLEKLKANVRIGGKGTPRRKVKRAGRTEADDSKVHAALQKMGAQTFTGVEQVNLFKDDGNVIHFGRPAVQQASDHDLFAIHGVSHERTVQEMLPEMIQSMSPESLAQLKQLSEQLQAQQAAGQGGEGAAAPAAEGEKKDAEIPELVEGETFDKVE